MVQCLNRRYPHVEPRSAGSGDADDWTADLSNEHAIVVNTPVSNRLADFSERHRIQDRSIKALADLSIVPLPVGTMLSLGYAYNNDLSVHYGNAEIPIVTDLHSCGDLSRPSKGELDVLAVVGFENEMGADCKAGPEVLVVAHFCDFPVIFSQSNCGIMPPPVCNGAVVRI